MSRGEWVVWWQGFDGPQARFFDDARGAFAYLYGFCSLAPSTVIGQGGYVVQVL